MFCLLHSYDWYASYDTGEETYRADVKAFKKKWLKLISAERIQEMIDETIEQERTELYKALGIDDVNGE